ncbi:NAD(P)/FAD-dependent oxidoreductase [Geomonas sp. Red32]|uniref:phytoene desaturase family protein n=1 Tax=Geomonas sp. Red32 TaxID=2912856 RepID=UPI00202CCD71|nr:NAD(P)/FAD-dependent oxidoreductase [Geomonas sp. Red32]MCM0083870.1 NAD(P)/FAD-dependent oxidoreductase [Geomonas sp. Red32]
MTEKTVNDEMREREVIVVGAGPNGLAAAVEMARAGCRVTILEAAGTIGGGTRTMELTLPGFRHDVCSAIHPLAVSSPFFNQLPLGDFGLRWIHPAAPLAHPFDDGTAAMLERDVAVTAGTLDREDAGAYHHLFSPLVAGWGELAPDILRPVAGVPKHPVLLGRFGLNAIRPAEGLARDVFKGSRARALFAGLSAHSFLPLGKPGSAAFGLVLGILGHAAGWPLAAGGSAAISRALADYLVSLGGTIRTGSRVTSVNDLPGGAVIILDVTPQQLLEIAGSRFDDRYRRRLAAYRYGPGIFKVDWALAGPIPWRARECARSATVHLGGTLEEIASSEREIWEGKHPVRPFVLLAQQSLFDPGRAPEGKHTGWAYCHVPNGSTFDMTERIEAQVERFAPGFRELILARHVRNTAGYQEYNRNFIGGDINGGVQDLRQIIARPVAGPRPYATPDPGIFICSSSTPPGGGVHGMCGYLAAHCALGGH